MTKGPNHKTYKKMGPLRGALRGSPQGHGHTYIIIDMYSCNVGLHLYDIGKKLKQKKFLMKVQKYSRNNKNKRIDTLKTLG